jgi:hypothetical protein
VLAPALLDAPLRGRDVIAMFADGDGPYRRLLAALAAVLTDEQCRTGRFEKLDLDDEDGPWARVRAALLASNDTPGIKASKVTKILHRKRPDLVPIFDSRLAGFYGVPVGEPWLFWPVLQRDTAGHIDWLRELAAGRATPDNRALSVLRTVDIVVWEHQSGCGAR